MRVQLGRGLARLRHGERRGIAERDAAMLGAELVLVDPGARAAAADPQSEPGQVVVEGDHLALAVRQFERGDGRLCELHGSPLFGKTMGRSARYLVRPRAAIDR